MNSSISVKPGEITGALKFIKDYLDSHKIKGREKTEAVLIAEETLISMSEHTSDDSNITVVLKQSFGSIYIDLRSSGEKFELFSENMMKDVFVADSDDMTDDIERTLRSSLIKGFENRLKYNYENGENYVRITAYISRYRLLYMTVTGLILGLIVGLLLKFLPVNVGEFLDENVFTLLTTIFMNGLQTVVTPMVFFSIATSISGFGNLSDIGKIGGKTILSYLVTSVISILIGIAVFFVFQPGDPSVAAGLSASQVVDADTVSRMTDLSFKNTIIGLIPSNIVRPFAEANMIQIIIIAVFCGIATGMIGRFSTTIKDIFEAMNELFLKITMIIVKFIPVVTFCSMASMMLSVGGDTLLSVLGIFAVTLLGFLAITAVYCVWIFISTRMNPFRFLKLYAPTMLQVFSISSSNASIPLNMKVCGEKLGISPKVYSFSIPLGATINMNGACIQLAISALAIAQIYGISITGKMLVVMCVTIIVLSMGAPGIPGMGIILLTVILTQFNVPVEGVSLIIGIYPILDMFITVVNCLGDVVTTFVVAKSEKLLNEDIFKTAR